jgi:hypothetical protein
MSTEIKDLEKKVDKILAYLHNDEGTGTKGLVADFKDHKEKFNKFLVEYHTQQEVKKARVSTWGAIGGAAVSALTLFIKWLIGDN